MAARSKWKTLKLTFERERTCLLRNRGSQRGRAHRGRRDRLLVARKSRRRIDSETPLRHRSFPPSCREESAKLEAQVPESEFAMIAEDREPHDARLHIRGNHKNLGEEVPRRFLQVIAGEKQPPITSGSGRLQIARLDGQHGQSADRARDGEPHLEASFRKRHRAFHRQLRQDGRGADASRTARLSGEPRLSKSGWSVKAHASADRAERAPIRCRAPRARNRRSSIPRTSFFSTCPFAAWKRKRSATPSSQRPGRSMKRCSDPACRRTSAQYQDGRGKPKTGPLDGARPAQHLYPGAA